MLIKKIIKNEWLGALLFLFIVNIALYWKFYFTGLLPFPGDLLVSFYFPWNGGGFAGFDAFTTFKGVGMADVIRQIIPWKLFVASQIKLGQIPLWNPYNFSGYALLANLQSAVFFPGTILYLLFPHVFAYILQTLSLPIIFGFGVYGFLRSQKLSKLASIFGAIVISNLPSLMLWIELQVSMQSVVVLPYILWLINYFCEKRKKWSLVIISLLLSISIFGGHIQTSVYVFILVSLYWFFKKLSLPLLIFLLLGSIGIAGIQLIPSAENYLLSAREGNFSAQLFPKMMLPFDHFATLFVPDFFGNPATRNFRSAFYEEWQMFFGIGAMVFASLATFYQRKEPVIKFFILIALGSIIFSCWPGAFLFQKLSIPVLSSGMPARLILLFQFSAGVLAAYGFEHWLISKGNSVWKSLKVISILGCGFLFIVIYLLLNLKTPGTMVSLRNTFFPLVIFCTVSAPILFGTIKPNLKRALVAIIFLAVIGEYVFFFTKNWPFAPEKFFFPTHPVITYLQKVSKIDRFQGDGTAHVDKNFSTYYQIQNAEGYDPLYSRRYGELFNTEVVKRSDVDLDVPETLWQNSIEKKRLMDILGVKYYLDKQDKSIYVPDLSKFSENEYALTWQQAKWAVYERKTALPRAFLTGKYEVISNKEKIIERLYDTNFPYRSTIILESKPELSINIDENATAKIVTYKPNEVVVNTNSTQNQILFLSDNIFPGWKAFVDDKPAQILRADYTFRAIEVIKGDHVVKFKYDPDSFKLGVLLSGVAIIGQLFFLRFGKIR